MYILGTNKFIYMYIFIHEFMYVLEWVKNKKCHSFICKSVTPTFALNLFVTKLLSEMFYIFYFLFLFNSKNNMNVKFKVVEITSKIYFIYQQNNFIHMNSFNFLNSLH